MMAGAQRRDAGGAAGEGLPAFDMAQLETLNASHRRIRVDSRQLADGEIFAAIPGESSDGRDHIADALAKGASGVLWEPDGFSWRAEWRVPHLAVPGLRTRLGAIAAYCYGDPSADLWVIGVTGTNGKTSSSHWIAQALSAAGKQTAVIGTLGNGFLGNLSVTANTTPDAAAIQEMMADDQREGAFGVAMEVSSHGLAQGRVNGVQFDVALLTNLSRDHLDYHGDMAAYGAAKEVLFRWPALKYAVLNLDDPFGAQLAVRLGGNGVQVIGYALGASDVACHFRLEGRDLQVSGAGLAFDVVSPWGKAVIRSGLLGRFNAANLLGVLAVLVVSGVPLTQAADLLTGLAPLPGRLERFGGEGAPLVVVDYAHTPDALEQVLRSLRETMAGQGRLRCVFGCGGGRDRGKRPLMGAAVSHHADIAVVTSDNPRREAPRAIIDEIVLGMGANYRIVEDRAAAIEETIAEADSGDIVLVAGKGHEAYQELGGEKLPFSDVEVARHALRLHWEWAE